MWRRRKFSPRTSPRESNLKQTYCLVDSSEVAEVTIFLNLVNNKLSVVSENLIALTVANEHSFWAGWGSFDFSIAIFFIVNKDNRLCSILFIGVSKKEAKIVDSEIFGV